MTPGRYKEMNVPRDMHIPLPAGYSLLANPLHFPGLNRDGPPTAISAASWGPELASRVQSCVMVSGVRLDLAITGGKWHSGYTHMQPRRPKHWDLEGGRVITFKLVQRWPGEVWVWPLGKEPRSMAPP